MQASRRKVKPVNQNQVFINALREVLGLEKLYGKTIQRPSSVFIHEWSAPGGRRRGIQ